jgi:chemosensory pili system protein ChpA (sensor histidine kinase/response regulator)
MKILLIDDTSARRTMIKEAIEKHNHSVVECHYSNDFLTVLEENVPELVVLDMETWKRGKSIYNYFRVGKKLENVPIILYNAEEDTYFIQDRTRNDKDRILSKPTDIETIIDAIQQNI